MNLWLEGCSIDSSMLKLSFRTWLSIITLVFIVVLLFVARQELAEAWRLMTTVNLWILSLVVPLILLNFYSAGEMIFSYLRRKGRMNRVSIPEQIRMALEMNFVNHALPSGGVSGISYMTWRLGKHGVSASRATMAQAVRFVMGFAGFATLLTLAVLMVTVDGNINRWIILVSSTLVSLMVAAVVVGMFFLQDVRRVRKAGVWLTNSINRLVRTATFGKKRAVLKESKVVNFMEEMNEDYLELKRDKKLLKQPYIWALVFTITDVMVYFVAFWALGSLVNPAPILIAYGVATLAGFAVVTPGGSGAYEALMVGFLVIAGLTQSTAIAGVIVARMIVLVVTIAFGYVLYQDALIRYGKRARSDV